MPTENGGHEIPSKRDREERNRRNLERGRYEGPVMGCVCPPGAEKTCQGPLCPRRAISPLAR